MTNESGQSLTEYVMLIMIVAGLVKLMFAPMASALNALSLPFSNQYARTYEYGRPDACGDETIDQDPPPYGCSGPSKHPKYESPNYMFGRGPK